MIFRSKKGLRRASLIAIPIVAVAAGTIAAATISNAAVNNGSAANFKDGRYIVTFIDDPVASYEGYQQGFRATKPAAGEKIDKNSADVKGWQQHLTGIHDAAMAKVGAHKMYDYTVTNNGLAAQLTGVQADALSRTEGVVSVVEDQLAKPDTTFSPEFLGLNAPGGIWAQLGGQGDAGRGVVVGVIDSGIWPESASFATTGAIGAPKKWNGVCVPGEDNSFAVNLCGRKLIGARYYVAGFGAEDVADEEFLSPRDGSGHGSHTSSTAAGNPGVPVSIDGNPIGTASGMAPMAHVAMYKVCWEGKPGIPAGCFNSDSVAAINDAILDGVDVLNYSIGGSSESNILDPVAQAFRAASNAGVFVANSAGNSGPNPSTLDHPAPWVTTVAAATFRKAYGVVELGDHRRFLGASTTLTLPTQTPLITSIAGKLASAADGDADLCFDNTLDPALVTGKIVICTRGVNARIDKSFEVKRAGGVGMVLVNPSPNSLNGDYHAVPSVHLSDTDGAQVVAYAGTAGATAAIVAPTAAEVAAAPDVPEITTFSSRGPSTTTGGDILKPDIAAPGNDVVAAVAPPTNHGRNFDFMSGTSMSSPHIAGIGALLKALHPDWMPSEIKSAMMTSAIDTKTTTSPFAQGAGFVNPNGAADPGLVYPTTPNDYRGYMISQGVQFAPPFDTLPAIAGPQLNQASIAAGQVPGAITVTRRVKNVGKHNATYTPTVTGLPGFSTQILNANDQPISSLFVKTGKEETFKVRFTRTTATLNVFVTGNLTWSDGTHAVRSPIALRPVPLAAPAEVSAASSASGSLNYSVTPGFTGILHTVGLGLAEGASTTDSVVTGDFDINNPTADADTKHYTVTLPSGSRAYRFSVDSADNTADLDLFVYAQLDADPQLELVGISATGAADEQVTLVASLPLGFQFEVFVNGFATPGGSTTFTITNYVVPAAATGNLTVSTNIPVTGGTPTSVSVNWTGLSATKKYFGMITYTEAPGIRTFVQLG